MEAVVKASVSEGIMAQVNAFTNAFNEVFPIAALKIFSPEEIDHLLCGKGEVWTKEQLVENMKFDHG